MAGWSTVPVSGGADATPVPTDGLVLKAQFDEVRAAILERLAAVGSGLSVTAAGADGAQALSLLSHYRSRIETLISGFWDIDGSGNPWSKATLLTAVLGRTNWLTVNSGDTMREGHINEMRTVLDALEWAGAYVAASTDSEHRLGQVYMEPSWDASWTAAKAAYAVAGWVASMESGCAGILTLAHGTYGHDIYHFRVSDREFAIPDIDVLDTKLLYDTFFDGTAGSVDVFEQASFAGAATNVPVAATASYQKLDVTTVAKNTTVHYSVRTQPAAPNFDPYRPADLDSATAGFTFFNVALIVKFQFAYRS